MSTQKTLDKHFPQTKMRSQSVKSFYGKKEVSPLKQQYAPCNSIPEQVVFQPTVKKLISFSSDESESDSENVVNCKRPINTKNDDSENCGISPSKQKRLSTRNGISSKIATPKQRTSRNAQAKTPSTFMAELELSPKKSVPCSRKKLFSDKYQEARLALHSYVPDNLIGRENEIEYLNKFVNDHLKNKTSGSIYISGPPGTGKTAALMKVRSNLPKNLQQIYINCTSLKAPTAIYLKISEELHLKADKKDCKTVVEKYIFNGHSRRKPVLFILDEIDNLENKNQSILYTIFEWPSISKSKVILIGISNALDLTDRILPRLQARCEVKPLVMHFAPYTNEQIVSIITDRLQQANVTEIFTNNALIFLAKKISAISGDIRKTLDICRRLFEIAETQRNLTVLQSKNGSKSDDPNAIVKVDIKDVMTILNHIYGGSQNIDEAEHNFPLQQKLLLCSLMLLLNKGSNKEVTIGRLYAVYKKVCKKRDLHIIDNSEFVSLCSLIETRGIIRVITKKDPQLSRILLEWDQNQLNAALSDKNLTSDIMNDNSCL